MDPHDATELSYKNGYTQGYKDAMEEQNSSRLEMSKRGGKYAALAEEAQHHEDILKAIADELSWRVVMRVVHKLRRKRGIEQ